MLNITEKSNEELLTLKHGANVFHEALSCVKQGEVRFHVVDENGEVPAYDLVYTANMLLFPEHVRALILKMTNGGALYAPFLTYDEENPDNLCLDFLRQYQKIEIECADEYSIGVARVALKYTDIPVYYADRRMEWFLDADTALHYTESLTEEHDAKALRITPSAFDMGYTKRDFSLLGSVAAFQNLFFWQHFTLGKKGPFKYIEVVLSQITGIGGILSVVSMVGNVGATRNLTAFLRPESTRYPESILCKYFHIAPKPEDAAEENTITVLDLAVLTTTWLCCRFPANFDESILDDEFASQMNEYAETVMGGRKTLGVLARGTDYVTNNLGDDRVHAKPAHMIPVIRKWMAEGGYEKIFLATEDKDIYDTMRSEFPGQIIAIAQERHSVSEMQEKNTTLIYEIEQKLDSGKAYYDKLEDTTVNYFYALYILSKCDAFMCSGQCNGWDVVRSFNKGKFEKEYKFTVGLDKNGGGREVGSAILSGKSFMYMDSGFHAIAMRLIFKENVNKELLQKAADQALTANPWAAYGIYEKDGSFYYHKKLVEIIKVYEADWEELPQIGGPEMEGHLLAVFCKENRVTVAAFHGLTDGKGISMFTEEMLRAYAAYLEGKNYTPVIGQYEDDNAEPFEAAAKVAEKMKLPEMTAKGAFMDKAPFVILKGFEKDDEKPCHFCIRADAEEYMRFSKAAGIRPAAALAALYAKAVLKVNGVPDRKMKVAVPADFREALEIPHTFRNCAMPPIMVDLEPETVTADISTLAKEIQKVIDRMTEKSAVVMAVRTRVGMMEQIPALPYKQTADLLKGFAGGPVFTFNASYAYRMQESDHSKLLDAVYGLYPAEGCQTVLEMMALPKDFCICINQGGDTVAYADAFCEVLKENGITCKQEDTLYGNAGYVALREFEKWQ
ncbi:MAG: hypothetical protein IKN07_07240 [Lachnospiraceae bacterium]|nr:hypothetical protein [Lachnospiraceae bacterium]